MKSNSGDQLHLKFTSFEDRSGVNDFSPTFRDHANDPVKDMSSLEKLLSALKDHAKGLPVINFFPYMIVPDKPIEVIEISNEIVNIIGDDDLVEAPNNNS